jgi:AcrR family transcriptional regulator
MGRDAQLHGDVKRNPGRPRSEDARRAILDATIALLNSRQLFSISAEGIAQKAGVGKATLYRWWPNKSAVIMEAFLEMMAPHIAFPTTKSAYNDLRVQLCRVVVAYKGEAGQLFRTLVAESQANTELAQALWTKYFSIRREQARQVIRRGVESGEFRKNLDIETIIDLLYGPMLYWMMIAPDVPDVTFVDRLLAQMRTVLLPEETLLKTKNGAARQNKARAPASR